MILFFQTKTDTVIAVKTSTKLSDSSIDALQWLFSDATLIASEKVEGSFIGPRREMITPWSTTAVEITENMNISGIERIEEFFAGQESYDKMLQRKYDGLDQEIFTIDKAPEEVIHITDLESYNIQEGLALPQKTSLCKGAFGRLTRSGTAVCRSRKWRAAPPPR